jgi:hypothetical protein
MEDAICKVKSGCLTGRIKKPLYLEPPVEGTVCVVNNGHEGGIRSPYFERP